MIVEKCPLLDELGWVEHGFYGRGTQLPEAINFLPQKHTDIVVAVGDPIGPEGADAIYTSQPHVMLGVKTADCGPVLLACRHSQQIAAVHAGWRGVLSQIIGKTIQCLVQNGAHTERMVAAIGPCLQLESFEVMTDLHDRFAAAQPQALPFFHPIRPHHYHFDMVGLLGAQLKELGISDIWQSQTDTLTNPAFASYRRRLTEPENQRTRNISWIGKTITT